MIDSPSGPRDARQADGERNERHSSSFIAPNEPDADEQYSGTDKSYKDEQHSVQINRGAGSGVAGVVAATPV